MVTAVVVTLVAIAAEVARQAFAKFVADNLGPLGAFLAWRWSSTVILVVGLAVLLAITIRPELISPGEPLYLHGKRIKVAEIIGPDGWIRDRTFEDCHIYGPAVVVPQGAGIFQSSTFEGNLDSLFIEIPPAPAGRQIMGVVGMKDCVIRRCTLHRIGLMGTAQQIVEMKKGFSIR